MSYIELLTDTLNHRFEALLLLRSLGLQHFEVLLVLGLEKRAQLRGRAVILGTLSFQLSCEFALSLLFFALKSCYLLSVLNLLAFQGLVHHQDFGFRLLHQFLLFFELLP